MRDILRWSVLWLVMANLLTGMTHAAEADLPQRAAKILDRYCHRCHRGAGSASGFEFDVRDVRSLTQGDESVVEKNTKDSLLWLLLHRGTMPPKSQQQLPRPTPEEAQVVADWINAGAPAFPVAKRREFVSLGQTLTAIRDDLKKLPDAKARKRQRYFTLTELHNNPGVTDETIHPSGSGGTGEGAQQPELGGRERIAAAAVSRAERLREEGR